MTVRMKPVTLRQQVHRPAARAISKPCGSGPENSILPILGDLDLQRFSEGRHFRTYDQLGAHIMPVGDVPGVRFAVWAPHARSVSVVGDFNAWDGRCHPMRVRAGSGIWELFIPGQGQGTVYQYEIRTQAGTRIRKTDPQGFYAELRPRTASIVWDLSCTEKGLWSDAEWMSCRSRKNPLREPMAIYEVHLGSWARMPGRNTFLNYRQLADRLVAYIHQQGYTHIELMPITEHPLDASWGYQVTGMFSPSSRFGTPDDFQYFVNSMHRNGIGVILDWVPAHFPRNDCGLIQFDGSALYEYADSRIGEHKRWGTKVFNFQRQEVVQFLINSALFWLDCYHIDGLRVDAVSAMLYRDHDRKEWLRNEHGGRENLEAIAFLRHLNEKVSELYPGAITIAEEATAFPMVSRPASLGGLGFTFKWNMGWMHDTLDYIALDPPQRKENHRNLTFGLMYAFDENFILPISHDEVVHLKKAMLDKMPGSVWQKFANLRLYYGFMWTHPGKKLLFMGQDFGQWREWSENRGLDWHLIEAGGTPHGPQPHLRLQRWLADLNRIYIDEPALHEQDCERQGFEWIDADGAEQSVLSYIRRALDPEDYLLVVANFTPNVYRGYRIGVPARTTYREVLNSDAAKYHGSDLCNEEALVADDIGWQSQPHSLEMTIPPLAMVVLKPER
ncbi:MAG: 1,4-alpha-glucan branching protein GlgB [Candidatus Accumulibacter phosphatis]|jgi:1,4-alpha-glucan branching enzyme|nr:1,4-alpha-glucan branching protein GlgB [Candidatus Accumulibacter contiguus]